MNEIRNIVNFHHQPDVYSIQLLHASHFKKTLACISDFFRFMVYKFSTCLLIILIFANCRCSSFREGV